MTCASFSVLQLDGSLAHLRHLVRRKKSHAIYQCQICHVTIFTLFSMAEGASSCRTHTRARVNPFVERRIYTKQVYMPENNVRDTVILGSGCSGLTAAIYAARSNLKTSDTRGDMSREGSFRLRRWSRTFRAGPTEFRARNSLKT